MAKIFKCDICNQECRSSGFYKLKYLCLSGTKNQDICYSCYTQIKSIIKNNKFTSYIHVATDLDGKYIASHGTMEGVINYCKEDFAIKNKVSFMSVDMEQSYDPMSMTTSVTLMSSKNIETYEVNVTEVKNTKIKDRWDT